MSFRKKILLSIFVLFSIFFLLLFSFSETIAGTVVLCVYTFIIGFIIYWGLRTILQIMDVISTYQEGKVDVLPRIYIKSSASKEFTKLANILNSLSERTQKQIESLKQQRKKTEGILESLGEGIIALNPFGKITFVNEVTCRLLSLRHEDLIGRALDELVSQYPDLLFRCAELVLQVLQTSESIVETWSLGSNLYLHLVAAPLADQNGAILVIQDKTSDYKMLAMGKDFIANASHELRTPITVLSGFAETLHDMPDLSPEIIREISGKILRTSLRLEKLVKSLLLLSNVENLSKETFQSVDLLPIVEQCKALQLAVNPEVSISIHCDQPSAMVPIDSDMVEMAILNLMDNAIKYSTHPAEITVRIRMQPRVVFEIEDKGIGIPEADIPHIFDRFYTVDKARSRQKGGAGLGLSIVRTIVEKHGGHIAVFSQLGKGTHFRITF